MVNLWKIKIVKIDLSIFFSMINTILSTEELNPMELRLNPDFFYLVIE
jgi:hypothetical protein